MKIQKDVTYGTGNGRDLMLDIYLPDAGPHTATAIILLHGGAWRMGDKSTMSVYAPYLTGHGFAVLATEYRLLGEAPWPAQIADVKTAVCWTKANSGSLGIDPAKVAVQGFSAGGHLALMAGGTADDPQLGSRLGQHSDRVAAVVAFFAPVEFTVDPPTTGFNHAAMLLGAAATAKDARQASPVHYVSEAFPPTFLLHGAADQFVSCATSLKMFDALQARGAAVELHLYPHHTHEFVRLPSMLAATQAEVALFLQRTVVDPDKYAKENLKLNMFATKEP